MSDIIDRAYILRSKIELMAVETIDDSEAAEFIELFPMWTSELSECDRGYKVRDEGNLYQAIHPIVDVSHNRKPSEDANNIQWQKIDGSGDEYPEWHQYVPGVGEPWRIGSKCTHNNKRWVCTLSDADGINVWEPGVYGWEEVS